MTKKTTSNLTAAQIKGLRLLHDAIGSGEAKVAFCLKGTSTAVLSKLAKKGMAEGRLLGCVLGAWVPEGAKITPLGLAALGI